MNRLNPELGAACRDRCDRLVDRMRWGPLSSTVLAGDIQVERSGLSGRFVSVARRCRPSLKIMTCLAPGHAASSTFRWIIGL